MEELFNKIDDIKDELDKTEEVIKIRELINKIYQDKELVSLINDYNNTRKDSIKEKIYNNELYNNYKKAETDLNILILKINQKLKKISDRGSCNL